MNSIAKALINLRYDHEKLYKVIDWILTTLAKMFPLSIYFFVTNMNIDQGLNPVIRSFNIATIVITYTIMTYIAIKLAIIIFNFVTHHRFRVSNRFSVLKLVMQICYPFVKRSGDKALIMNCDSYLDKFKEEKQYRKDKNKSRRESYKEVEARAAAKRQANYARWEAEEREARRQKERDFTERRIKDLAKKRNNSSGIGRDYYQGEMERLYKDLEKQ